MDKFDNVENFVSSNPITNYIGIKHYDIVREYCIKPQCFFINYSMNNTQKKMDWLQMQNFVHNFVNWTKNNVQFMMIACT
jgi:hypothetical protein